MSAHEPPRPTTVDAAKAALATTDAETRRLLVRSLSEAPSDVACGVLRRVLGDEDWRVRKEGIHLAQDLADRADVVPILVDALRASAEEVALRNAAVEALASIGAPAAEAVETVLAQGESALDADQRKLAVEVLAAARLPRSLPTVIRAADDPDPNVRAAAAEAIGAIGGEAAIPALLSILHRAPPTGEGRLLRLIALEGLNHLGAEVPLVRVQPFVDDKILRHAAIAALARCADPAAFAPIVDAMADPSRHVAETAMRAFVALRRTLPEAEEARAAVVSIDPRARDRVVAAAHAEDLTLRRGALAVLAVIADAPAIDLLVRALADPDVAEEVEEALVAHEDRSLPRLVAVARDASAKETRLGALRLVGRFGDRREVMETLRGALGDPDPDVVVAAAAATSVALGAGAAPTNEDVRRLLRAAARKEPRVASTALLALRTLARRKPDAVRPLLGEIESAADEAPIACALLAVVGGAENVPWLSRAISAESPRTRRAAVEALGAIGGDAAARSIALAVTDEVADVALAAIRALGRTRDATGAESPGIPALLRLLGSTDDAALVTAAVRAIGATGSSAAAASLTPLVTSDVPAVACAALEALTDLSVDDLPELVFSALAHPSSVVVRAALDAVETIVATPHPRFRSSDDRESLLPRLIAEVSTALGHPSWEVRRRAAELLPRLAVGAWASTVRPLLAERAANEQEPAVREAIDRAVVEIEARLGLRTVPPPSGSEG